MGQDTSRGIKISFPMRGFIQLHKSLMPGAGCRHCVRLVLILLLLSFSTSPLAVGKFTDTAKFSIAPQDVASALIAFASQAQIELLYLTSDVTGEVTAGVSGQMSILQALEVLLEGTQLNIVELPNGRLSIKKALREEVGEMKNSKKGLWAMLVSVFGVTGSATIAAQNPEGGVQSIEEVIVTASKRQEKAFDVAASITVLKTSFLEDTGMLSLQDYATYIPGLSFTSGGSPGQSSLTLRGIAPVAGASTVGSYLDDAPVGSSSIFQRAQLFALDLFPYDIEQIEIVRGPQGTLYGASSMGGIMKYNTVKPNLEEFEARIGGDFRDIQGAEDLSWGVRAKASFPIIENKLALSLSAFQLETAGYIDNVARDQEDVNEVEQEGYRVALLWAPTDKLSINLQSMYQEVDSADNAFVALNPLTNKPTFGDLKSNFGLPWAHLQETEFSSATINYELDFATFTSVTSYSDTQVDQVQDVSLIFGGGPFLLPFNLKLGLEKFTQEFRLTSNGNGDISWLIGAFYTDEKPSNSQIVSLNTDPDTSLAVLVEAGIDSDYEEMAVFGDITYQFTEQFDVSVGLRWAENDQDFAVFITGFPTDPPSSSSEDVVTWSFSPRYLVSDNAMGYARIATSYRPGGPLTPLPTCIDCPTSVDSDTLTSYEVGGRAYVLDSTLLLEGAIYQIDWEDIQTNAQFGGFSTTINGGEAEIQGAELSAVLTPSDKLRLAANLSYTDSEFKSELPALGASPGDPLPGVGELQASLTVDYRHALQNGYVLSMGGGWRYIDDSVQYDPALNEPALAGGDGTTTLESYDVLDLRLGLSGGAWQLTLFANNVLDERAYLGNFTVYDALTFPAPGSIAFNARSINLPRALGLRLDMHF